MLLFEVLATAAVLAVMFGATISMVDIMNGLDRAEVRFVPAAWLVTGWGIIVSLAGSIFVVDILRQVCGVK